jgi:hypothetical protein
MEIAQLLYADNHRTPDGFYREPVPMVPGYIATSHLKNTDIANAVTQFELCSDDWSTALSWSDQVAAATSASSLTDTVTTTSYFEFGRTRPGALQGYIRMRVFRCDYLDRSSVDLRSVSSTAGQFNLRPIAATDLQTLIEYLWQFTSYNNYGNAVLKSAGTVTSNGLQHTLTIATLNSSVNCDQINVIGWTHTVDTQTGMLRLNIQSLWNFGARRAAGIVELCNPN